MKILSIIFACFSALGALDLILGNRLKIGKEFEKGVKIIAPATLSMAGMLVLAPVFGELLQPLLGKIPSWFPFEPSTIAGSLLANDMGGAPLATQLAKSESAGYFNGLIIGAMTGATISFTLPYTMSTVKKERRPLLFLGIACGLTTVPLGALVSAVMLRLPLKEICINLYPLVILTAVLVFGILKAPTVCTKVFNVIGLFLKALVIAGLAVGIFEFLTGWDVLAHSLPFESAMDTIIHIAAVDCYLLNGFRN